MLELRDRFRRKVYSLHKPTPPPPPNSCPRPIQNSVGNVYLGGWRGSGGWWVVVYEMNNEILWHDTSPTKIDTIFYYFFCAFLLLSIDCNLLASIYICISIFLAFYAHKFQFAWKLSVRDLLFFSLFRRFWIVGKQKIRMDNCINRIYMWVKTQRGQRMQAVTQVTRDLWAQFETSC